MINVDMKRGRRPGQMATRVRDPESLNRCQQLRRKLSRPWDQASIGEIGGGLILVFLVIAILRHWMI